MLDDDCFFPCDNFNRREFSVDVCFVFVWWKQRDWKETHSCAHSHPNINCQSNAGIRAYNTLTIEIVDKESIPFYMQYAWNSGSSYVKYRALFLINCRHKHKFQTHRKNTNTRKLAHSQHRAHNTMTYFLPNEYKHPFGYVVKRLVSPLNRFY